MPEPYLSHVRLKGANDMTQDPYTCKECGASFSSKSGLEEHNRTMHSRYTCEACGETFNSESELETHNRKMHPDRQTTSTP